VPQLQWTRESKSQTVSTVSTGRRYRIWQGADGFLLVDRADGTTYGPYRKAQAARDKAQALHDAEYHAPPAGKRGKRGKLGKATGGPQAARGGRG